MDAHLISAFDESVSDLGQRRGGTESMSATEFQMSVKNAWVIYLGVSTARQGQSGLGFEAQQDAISRFVRDGKVIASFTEIESGKRCDRPQLNAALAKCRETGAALLIGKLDRLARDVHFISGLMKSDLKFVACDMPDAGRYWPLLDVGYWVLVGHGADLSRRRRLS